jgi:hypothetical protein
MFNAVSEAERDAMTVVVFIGTFFVTLGDWACYSAFYA